MNLRVLARTGLLVLAMFGAHLASAEPYIAMQQGYKCMQCHVNPTGGGLRNDFGAVYSQNVMAARPLPKVQPWDGRLGEYLRVGADVREAWTRTDIQDQDAIDDWELQEVRVYGAVEPIRDKLAFVIDGSLAEHDESVREAYVKWADTERGWYAKGGRFFLPFGWRVQDDGTFVRQASGINRTGFRDYDGVEVGLETAEWSAQLALTTDGSTPDSESDVDTGSGEQLTAQAVWMRPTGRLGVAASHANADSGDRTLGTIFGGGRTGPVAWLGEVDFVHDEAFADGARDPVAVLAEADWTVAKGHNVRLSGEWLEPDSGLDDDEQTRWSLVYEYTPIAFVQFRAGARVHDGNPQNDVDNRNVYFVELHGFF